MPTTIEAMFVATEEDGSGLCYLDCEASESFRLADYSITLDAGRHGIRITAWLSGSPTRTRIYHRLFASWDRIESLSRGLVEGSDGCRVAVKSIAVKDMKDHLIGLGLA